MTDLTDRAKLMQLSGDQECECCGRKPIDPSDVDVVDGEVTCLDCVATYYPAVYERRTSSSSG